MEDRFLRLSEVRARTALSRSSIYAYMGAGTFPAPVHIGERSVAWIESDIAAWISERVAIHRKSRSHARAVANG